MRSGARLFAGLLLVFMLATLPTPAAAFLHDPEAADAGGAHLRSAAILSSSHKSSLVAHPRLKRLSHAALDLIALSAERFAPSLRFEQVRHFVTPARTAEVRARAYDATGPPAPPLY
jgi:hypothetical protein